MPAHGARSGGTGAITWHPERGIQFRIEADAGCGYLANAQGQHVSGAGGLREISRDPQLVARIAGVSDPINVYELTPNVETQLPFGETVGSAKLVISGKALAASVTIERDSELSFAHETLGTCRLLVPDLCVYRWPTSEEVRWELDGAIHSRFRCSCPLSKHPNLTLFSASVLPQRNNACWLAFETDLIPQGEYHWYLPDACLAARSLLSFLCGKRIPFLFMDRFVDGTHLKRTYYGTGKVDDQPQAALSHEPAPLHSFEHCGSVVASLPSLFATYLRMRKWFDLDWVVGPLWYATTAYLDDRLGLASVALERFAAAHDAYLQDNPAENRPRRRFLTKQQSKALRTELSNAVGAFAKERGIDLTASRSAAVAGIIEGSVNAISRIDNSLTSPDVLESLRAKMKGAVERANTSGKLKLEETKAQIIDQRISSFAEKTNPDKLVEALEFDGLSVGEAELEAVAKRNDCLHGRRTLSLDNIGAEVLRFDILRTLINKSVLARLGYTGLYVDYGERPPQGPFPLKMLADQLKTEAGDATD